VTIVDGAVEARIAERLRARRLELGLSLGDLGTRSGVSKTMIARVEASASNPTAGVLGRLCAGLGITMSALMASVETADAVRLDAGDQPRWQDPETGLERVAVSPQTPFGAVEIARLRLPPSTVVDYPTPPRLAFAQHLVGVSGRVRFTLGEQSFELGPGDCVAARIDRPTRFEALSDEPAEYLVVVVRSRG
jgi:transcriptional regulator with XRE-family HTH domain